jgi:hypothetical protein
MESVDSFCGVVKVNMCIMALSVKRGKKMVLPLPSRVALAKHTRQTANAL